MLMGSPVGGLMHWPRCLAALFVVLPLAGCASVAAGPRPGAERALSARRTSRHQWNALTGEPDSNPSSEPGRPVPIVTSAPNGVREAPPPAPPGVAVTIEAVHARQGGNEIEFLSREVFSGGCCPFDRQADRAWQSPGRRPMPPRRR